MKKYMLNPHLMLMSFFVLVLAGSSSTVKAQDEKKIVRSIIISDGDTIINGKKISEATREERIKLKKELKEMEDGIHEHAKHDKKVIIKRKTPADEPAIARNNDHMHEFRFEFDDKMPGGKHLFRFDSDSIMLGMNPDSIMKTLRFKLNGLDSNLRNRIITMHRDFDIEGPQMFVTPRTPRPPMPPDAPGFFERGPHSGMADKKNSSSFNYNYVDKDGIPSRMSIRISDAEKEKLKAITGSENTSVDLDVKDLTLFPNFSNGKAGLSFNLDGRGTTKIKILNSDMKAIFTDEQASFQGNYMKQISLPQNGVYYITISQNSKWFVRKLIKN
ncbi:T9SS type A sorting domain-containing protein [Daejeonella sp. H1SJ63]|uniref:T9SS type A sorting domain-containing protein n=1 Tax=Daejeonella sp. H1SJ63 TaxID=3034145 RepID=UPI0023EC1A71|nr:T9SS type A sorting domain-containing protein [Daejeonella sp. H1SJ63]